MEDRVCRNCHESGGDLIAPCACTGSMRWVHRDCLDKWRSVSQNPSSFTSCDICGQKYHLRPRKIGPWPYIRLYLLIFIDIISVLAVIGAVIVLCGLVVFGVERVTHFSSLFGSTNYDSSHGNSGLRELFHNALFLIFVGGLALLCFIIGCGYIIYSIVKCMGNCCSNCCTTTYTSTTYDYNAVFPIWWWWYVTSPPPRCYCFCCCDCLDCCCDCANCVGDCCAGDCGNCDCNISGGDCGGCDCGGCDCGDSDCGGGGAILLIILAIIVAIIICIGAVVGTFLVVSFIVRMVSGHLDVLNRQKKAQALVVVDLSEEDNNKDLADGEDVVLLSSEEKAGGPAPPPAAPVSSVPNPSGVTYAPSTAPGTSGADILILPPIQPQPQPQMYAPQPGTYQAGPSAPPGPGVTFL